MSTRKSAPSPNAKPNDPLFVLKALFIGIGLGFVSVVFIPYFAPPQDVPSWILDLRDRVVSKPQASNSRTAQTPEPGVSQRTPPQTNANKEPVSSKQRNAETSSAPNVEKNKLERLEGSASRDATAQSPDQRKEPDPRKEQDQSKEDVSQEAVTPANDAANQAKGEAEPVLIPAVQLTFPKPFSADAMTKALDPILSFKLTDQDAATLKDIIANAKSANEQTIQKLKDPSARKFAEWYLLRNASVSSRPVREFRAENPLFPAPLPDINSEKSLFLSDASSAEVLKVFANRPPRSGAGKATLGAALIETGERERGVELIKQAWSRHELDDQIEEKFLQRFGDVLNENDHTRRKAWLTARVRAASKKSTTEEGKPKVTWMGLKAVARLRGKRGKGKLLHAANRKPNNSKTNKAAKASRTKALKERGARGAKALRNRGGKASQKRALRQRKKRASVGPLQAGRFAMLLPSELALPVSMKKAAEKQNESEEKKEKSEPTLASTSVTANKPEAPKPPTEPAPSEAAKTVDKPKASEKKPEDKKTEDKKPTAQQKAAAEALKLTREAEFDSPGLLNRLKNLRKQEKDERVWSILRSLKPDHFDVLDPEKWWDFRRGEVRRALNHGYASTAYHIAKAHGPLEGENLSEAEFLSGWIALRFLKKPDVANEHFAKARTVRGNMRDEARNAYWLAMAKLELGLKNEARALFQEAAARPYIYYGQLAKQALEGDNAICDFRAPPEVQDTHIATFLKEDAFKALMIIKQLDLSALSVSFALDLARQIQEPAHMALMLEVLERTSPQHVAIRAAKIALLRGFAVDAYAFPALLPKFDPFAESASIEPPLLNALTRQESEFHAGATSPVGAKGLMQLMPGTAKLVATWVKLKHDPGKLTSDPSYNVTLGSAYLSSLLSTFNGSYILSLAAYNAGPGRIGSWVKEFGDPRDKQVDPIDWVERIPFTETRNYVQRIMESAQLYRCRFENGKTQLQIMKDLHRGRSEPYRERAALNF